VHILFPSDWRVDSYSRLLVNADTLERLRRGDSTAEIMKSSAGKMDSFRTARLKYLLYE
jgi:hypothetical protein